MEDRGRLFIEERTRKILESEALRHRALAKLMEEPLLREDHLAVAEALEKFLREVMK